MQKGNIIRLVDGRHFIVFEILQGSLASTNWYDGLKYIVAYKLKLLIEDDNGTYKFDNNSDNIVIKFNNDLLKGAVVLTEAILSV